MSDANESSPSGGCLRDAGERISEVSIPCPYDRRPRPTFDLGRIVERRRAHRELNTLLGVRGYPDIELTYGLRSALQEA